MLHELSQFIEYLENNSPEVFSENRNLEKGLYVFLEKEGNELIIKEENVLKVDESTEKNTLHKAFLERRINTEMMNAMKSFNSGPKVYIAIGTPFGIAFSGKGFKLGKEKRLSAAEAYFKAASKYIEKDNQKYLGWFDEFQHFVKTKMFEYLESQEEYQKVNDNYMYYFFLKEPQLEDFIYVYNKYLSERVFNDNSYNIPRTKKEAIPDENTFGIPDSLSGFNSKKPFLEHRTAPNDVNHRVNLKTAFNLQKFFDLQRKNKIFPNPMPIFVDEAELTGNAVKFYKEDTKKGHKEIIEDLLKVKENLQNYYLIYFQNGLKGSRIIDLDFVPVFRYKTDDMPEIKPLFNMKSKDKGEVLHSYRINNIFEFQEKIANKIFNGQLLKSTEKGIWLRYFDNDIKPEHGATEAIVNLLYKYRKAFYDYIYKSKEKAISGKVFYDIISNSILDDIRHDKDQNKTFIIKEKLNIWYSLYNYFINSNQTFNMANNIERHRELVIDVAEGKKNIIDDDEYAFIAGQVIYYLLSKSKSSDKSYSRLEPFLQKSNYLEFRKALSSTFNTYKHENFSAKFRNPFANVLDYIPKTKDFKELIPTLLAGFFSDCTLFADKEDIQSKEEK